MSVRTRAMSRRTFLIWLVLLSCWVPSCMRRPNWAFSKSPSSVVSAAASLLRSSDAFIVFSPSGAEMAHDKRRLDRQLRLSQSERVARKLLGHAVHFIQHLARLNFGYVVLGVTLTVTHPNFSRLRRDRLIRENPNPDPTTTLD